MGLPTPSKVPTAHQPELGIQRHSQLSPTFGFSQFKQSNSPAALQLLRQDYSPATRLPLGTQAVATLDWD